ncbi:MAG: ATPase [Neomegalonema sp.]|nr:ATPase [Neomegalonema sp.]
MPPGGLASVPQKAIALMGMSGVGKTRLANILCESQTWYHYNVDYRIGTRYLGEHIESELKREAIASSPKLRDLLLSNSISLKSNLSFGNLTPLSEFLGKPGDPNRGGLRFETYLDRQRLHREAEIMAMLDTPQFIDRARSIYGYPHFLCDTSGSLVEIVDPSDPYDPIMTELASRMLFVLIEGAPEDERELEARFARKAKPIYYDEEFLTERWDSYLDEFSKAPDEVDPDHFVKWGFRQLLHRRTPRYREIADRWGVRLAKSEVTDVQTEQDFIERIDAALQRRAVEQPAR